MGLSAEENQRRRDDERVKYITKHIRNADSKEDYVFISYKSDDWERVLGDIVYKLVKDYGLNVYFDGDFNGHNPLWTEQFPENMEAKNCLGVLAFIDDLYTQSYATLMELLYSQAGCQDGNIGYEVVKKPVIPVYIGQISNICDTSDTGLGVGYYDDGKVNPHAAAEKELFEELFETASESPGILKNTKRPYKKEKKLTKQLCAAMCREVIASIGANDNLYGAGVTLEDIVNTIKNQCGDTVFGSLKPPKPTQPPKSAQSSTYKYTYQGKEYTAKKLAEYMNHVFELLAADYPDMMEAAADREDISFVARKDDVDNGILPANKLNYFLSKKEHCVGNSLYYVSNRYNQAQGTAQVEKLVQLCEADTFRLIEKPEPNKKSTGPGECV